MDVIDGVRVIKNITGLLEVVIKIQDKIKQRRAITLTCTILIKIYIHIHTHKNINNT